MAINQIGIAISIKAFLPTTKDLDQNLAALMLVKDAHETGDYSSLLAAAQVEDIKTEQKTRRVEVDPAPEPVFASSKTAVLSEPVAEIAAEDATTAIDPAA